MASQPRDANGMGSNATGGRRDVQRQDNPNAPNSPRSKAVNNKTARFLRGTNIKKPPSPDAEGLMAIMIHPMNVLLLALPLGIAADWLKWGDVYAFWLNFVAMIPLAKILGDATEELAASLKNDMIAGLLNATFGNAVEVVITVQSLRAGLIRIVKTSLLGSVLSNTLLVLGMSFFCGGIFTTKKPKSVEATAYKGGQDSPSQSDEELLRTVNQGNQGVVDFNEKIQSFSMLGALVNTSMLLVSCLCFSLITIFRLVLINEDADADDIVLPVSRMSALIVMMAYVAYIVFQLVTHKEAMGDGPSDDEEDEGAMSVWLALVVLFVCTVIIAYSSDILVRAIEGVTEGAHLSEHFIGIILLPIVGNACEHAAAVRFAMQDKLGLSVSIAVGSSTQIALFVVPLSVVMGWFMGVDMDLNFGLLNSSLITLSVIVVLSMVVDGQSNWLQGYLLCSVYGIISIMYWNLPSSIRDGISDGIRDNRML